MGHGTFVAQGHTTDAAKAVFTQRIASTLLPSRQHSCDKLDLTVTGGYVLRSIMLHACRLKPGHNSSALEQHGLAQPIPAGTATQKGVPQC